MMKYVIPNVSPVNRAIEETLRLKIDQKTKPLGALGQLEDLALQIGLIQNTLSPSLNQPVMLVCAGNHGLAQAGVSAYPAEVTAQMVLNFLGGGAAINVFCRQHQMLLEVINAGVKSPLLDGIDHPALINTPIADGTANSLHVPAMMAQQCEAALALGAARVAYHAQMGSNVCAFGEMGIGNTSAAALLMAVLTGIPLADCVGRGTGLDHAGVQRKLAILEQVLQRHTGITDPFDVLAAVGGLEIAAIVGGMLAAAERKMVVVVDGFIATSAALVACAMRPTVREYCVFAHCSDESGHARMLAYLNAEPLLRLNLRLGEGSGAALAWPLLQSAVAFLNEMATFAQAGVSEKS
jgi:nicotinate-nucleotide--dimethylbenzimidazole phosphoribosyltransferase